MATQQQAESAQSHEASVAKLQELLTRNDVPPVIRNAQSEYHGSMSDYVISVCDRKYLVISESEWSTIRTYGWLRSPRFSDNESDQPVTSSIMFFSSVSDAINHYIYFEVAHGFFHNTKSDQASGKHVILSGIFRNHIDSIPFVNGSGAGIHQITLPYEDDPSFTVEEISVSPLRSSSAPASIDLHDMSTSQVQRPQRQWT